jgi:hypothetical protein
VRSSSDHLINLFHQKLRVVPEQCHEQQPVSLELDLEAVVPREQALRDHIGIFRNIFPGDIERP